jgi:hypothetical protein
MSSKNDRPQPGVAIRPVRHDGASSRSQPTKEGVAALPDGSSQNVKLSLLVGEIALLDRLAMDIRLSHGAWITRSGIVTALIEAAMCAEGELER